MKIGVMLGRLSPSNGRGIQFFPGGTGEWEAEFALAKELGISHFEWVWDTPENPLLDKAFRAQARGRITDSGIPVKGVDLQFLVKNDVANVSDDTFNRICEAIADIDGVALEPPFLEGSSLLDEGAREARIAGLARLLEIAKKHGLLVNIETDLSSLEYKKLLELPGLGVCYDSGNSHHFGYDVREEWQTYGSRIRNVQIKDRPLGGSTVPLGTGGTDFAAVFKAMKEAGYTGLVTLQAARGQDGKEAETVKGYMEFIQSTYESI